MNEKERETNMPNTNDVRDMDIDALRAELEASRATTEAAVAARVAAETEAMAHYEALEESERKLADAEKASLRMAEELAIRPMVPGAVVGKPVFFALCEISNSGRPIHRGFPLPFDPLDPPHGYTGLVEGVHFERR